MHQIDKICFDFLYVVHFAATFSNLTAVIIQVHVHSAPTIYFHTTIYFNTTSAYPEEWGDIIIVNLPINTFCIYSTTLWSIIISISIDCRWMCIVSLKHSDRESLIGK